MTNPRTPERLARVRQVLGRRQKDLELVLDNIHDPHNVSAIYRSCDAFGVARVHLYYSTHQFPDLKRKSSSSAHKWVESIRHHDPAAMFEQLRGRGLKVLATSFSPTARPLTDYDLSRPTAIIFGNEHAGVGPDLFNLVQDQIYIPMQGMVQSLNVSVAAAVILYEAWRQRMALGRYDQPDYTEQEMDALTLTWLKK